MKKIVCFHLLNVYSGSPKALFVVLQELLDKGFVIDLVTTQGGVLDNLKAQMQEESEEEIEKVTGEVINN